MLPESNYDAEDTARCVQRQSNFWLQRTRALALLAPRPLSLALGVSDLRRMANRGVVLSGTTKSERCRNLLEMLGRGAM